MGIMDFGPSEEELEACRARDLELSKQANRTCKSLKAIKWTIFWVIFWICYLNVGYLIAYAFDPKVFQTAASRLVYHIVDFGHIYGKFSIADDMLTYGVVTLLWPIAVIFIWIINILSYLIPRAIILVSPLHWLGLIR